LAEWDKLASLSFTQGKDLINFRKMETAGKYYGWVENSWPTKMFSLMRLWQIGDTQEFDKKA